MYTHEELAKAIDRELFLLIRQGEPKTIPEMAYNDREVWRLAKALEKLAK
jgi:predicted transcriptional regulator